MFKWKVISRDVNFLFAVGVPGGILENEGNEGMMGQWGENVKMRDGAMWRKGENVMV